MVTSSSIPEEANEPSEPPLPPASSNSSNLRSTSSNSPGDYQSNPAPAGTLHGVQAGSHSYLDVDKTAVVEAASPASGGSSFTYTGSSFTPAGTTAVVSKGTSQKYKPSGESLASSASSSSSASAPYEGTDAHCFTPGEVAASLGTSLENGLSAEDAAERLARDGPNKLEGEAGVGVWRVLLRQVSNSLTLVSLDPLHNSHSAFYFFFYRIPISFFSIRRHRVCCIASSASHFLFLRIV